MTIPQFSLLAFAMWTIIVPLGAIAYYRWSRILAGAAPINAFPADAVSGADWYRRAMRAHANCVENLPVFGSIVVLISLLARANRPAWTLWRSWCSRPAWRNRPCTWPCGESARTVSVRFTCFLVQVVCMLALAVNLLVVAGVHLGGRG